MRGQNCGDRIKVLVVDDSKTMRHLIMKALAADPGLHVVGVAEDAYDARRQVRALKPDVITLDVEMPRVDGVTFLERLMAHRPTPVVMVSSFTRPGADSAVRALAAGAFDCVEKPSPERPDALSTLPGVVRAAVAAHMREAPPRIAAPPPVADGFAMKRNAFIMIGASTGGVEAIETLLRAFPENCPPTLITQHMPEAFSAGFAAHLNAVTAPKVRLAGAGAPLCAGEVLIAPGGRRHLRLDPDDGRTCYLWEGPKIGGHRPSVDALFESALPFAASAAAALLTGIGADGAAGLAALRTAGAATFAQDEASSVVYGMPKAALAMGAVDAPTPLSAIGSRLLASCADKSGAARLHGMRTAIS